MNYSERKSKQKSQDVCKWEKAQQEEFQKWTDPAKDSLLETDQITFLQAIGFPFNADREHDNVINTSSSGRNTSKKRPSRNSTGRMTSKKAKKVYSVVPHELKQRRLRPQVVNLLILLQTHGAARWPWKRTRTTSTNTRVLLESSLSSFVSMPERQLQHSYTTAGEESTLSLAGSGYDANIAGRRCSCKVEMCHCMYHCKCFDRPSNKRVQGSRKDSLGKNYLPSIGCNSNDWQQSQGCRPVAEYGEKCLRDIGIEEVSERTGLFLCHEIDSK